MMTEAFRLALSGHQAGQIDRFEKAAQGRTSSGSGIDYALLLVAFTLALVGLVMVTSASVDVAEAQNQGALYYFWHHSAYLLVGICAGFAVLSLPVRWWDEQSWLLLAFALLLLMLVLIPGVGKTVNGSARWLTIGFINIQPSEIAKVFLVVYTASYIVRHFDQVKESWWGFVKPLLVLILVAVLLLLEPDFGALVVTLSAVIGMIFLSGVRITHFSALLAVCACSIGMLAVSQAYRLERLTAYIDPWANQYDTGYQLTQALIAFGRGEWFGVGIGNSVQKLFYLPEAHTDFVFAILGEELGLAGVLVIIGLYALLLWRGLKTGRRAELAGQKFNALVAYGITLLLSVQTLINLGVNTGLLPTKGLTLPLLSYGGSSLIVSCICIGLLLRVYMEIPASTGELNQTELTRND